MANIDKRYWRTRAPRASRSGMTELRRQLTLPRCHPPGRPSAAALTSMTVARSARLPPGRRGLCACARTEWDRVCKGDTLCPPEAVAGWLDLTLACNGRAGPLWMPAFAGMTKEFRCQFTQPSIFAPSMAPRVRSWQKSTSDFCRRALRALRTSAPSLPANALSVRLLIAHCRTGRRFLQAAGRDQLGPVSGSSRRKRSGGRLAPAQGGNGACDCHRSSIRN